MVILAIDWLMYPVDIAVLPSDRRLDALADVTESVDGTDAGVLKMGQMVEMEVDALRGKRARRGLKSSSEEMTVPQELSKLTAFFKYILDGEIRKLEAERDEEPVKVELGEMLKFHAEKNGSVINKRDMALGFLQTLILKTAGLCCDMFQDPCSKMQYVIIHLKYGFVAQILLT